ncbi:MAG TPA: hypothetical protein VNC61_16505 [Acidimicrobiales bacterium]|nr:hypothetical protein [Acidimicrobiales bacterium]
MSDMSQGIGWWIASDGKWYPPELHPSRRQDPVSPPSTVTDAHGSSTPASATSYGGSSPLSDSWTSVDLASRGAEPTSAPVETLTAYGQVGPEGWAPAPGPATPQTGGGRTRRLSRRAMVGAAAILVAVIAIATGLVIALGSGGPAYPKAWNPRVLSIVHFVEHERGLTFKHPVKVEFLNKAKFNKAVSVPQPQTSSDRSSLARALEELRALGLVHGNVNLAHAENTLQQSDVVGLYVPEDKTVFVRGSSLTPFVRVTLAHELTHALQDQYFDITTLRSSATGDDSALTALIEGDAVRTQTAYEKTLSAADRQAYDKASNQFQGSSSSGSSNVPAILSDMLEYPYAFGPTFIDHLVDQGGTGAIDNAFRHPPVAQAQIVNPDAYPIGWTPAKADAPSVPHGDRVTDPASPFGQITLFEVLGSRLGYATAWSAVQGWQGDSSLAYRDHDKTCDAVAVRMQTSARAKALAGVTRQWALAGVKQAVVHQTGRMVTIRSCDPGASAPRLPTITPSAFDVLAARAQIIDGFMTESQVDFALGACVSDELIADLGPSGYHELTANSLTAGQKVTIRQLIGTGAVNCRSRGIN